MLKRPWIFLTNPFLVATRNNYEKALRISAKTDAALAADPALATLYAFYHPFHLALEAAYAAWVSSGGSKKSATATLKTLLKGLTQQVNAWDFEIQHIATKGSDAYLTFFPNGHKPFLQGKQETRIGALAALSDALGAVTPGPAVKASVDDYLTDLRATNVTQKGKITTTDNLSSAVEAARIGACEGLYKVLGQLMVNNYQNTEPIGNYFDLEAIRDDQQDHFTGPTGPQEHYSIVQRTMEEDDQIFMKNNGLVPLTFYFANTKNGGIPAGVLGLTLQPGESTHVPASSLGQPATDKFLSVYNASEIAEGEWEVEL